MERFLPAADEVHRLQSGEDAECRHFQSFCEQGHYGGRTVPSTTRQGIYAVAPSGAFLASVNTRSADDVLAMLRRALDVWDGLAPAQRRLSEDRKRALAEVWRWERLYPEDGLVLRVTSRDLGEPTEAARAWHRTAWNHDYAWFRREEARAFLPEAIAVGSTHEVPKALVERLARFHFVDNVRGQTSPFAAPDVRVARLSARVVALAEGRVTLAFVGRSTTRVRGRWSVGGLANPRTAEQVRGVDVALEGEAVFELASGRFTAFALRASGTREGGTRFNERGAELAPSPAGFVLELVGDLPEAERVAPAFVWQYGWR